MEHTRDTTRLLFWFLGVRVHRRHTLATTFLKLSTITPTKRLMTRYAPTSMKRMKNQTLAITWSRIGCMSTHVASTAAYVTDVHASVVEISNKVRRDTATLSNCCGMVSAHESPRHSQTCNKKKIGVRSNQTSSWNGACLPGAGVAWCTRNRDVVPFV